jgi:hypothetical protein
VAAGLPPPSDEEPTMNRLVTTPDGEVLVLNVACGGDAHAPLVAREPVWQSDVFPMRDDLWQQGLRRGELPWDVSSLATCYRAARRGGSMILDGLLLELASGSRKVQCLFGVQCFDMTLERALREPLESGRLSSDAKIHYWLSCETAGWAGLPQADDRDSPDAMGMQVRIRAPAWQPEPAVLDEYLSRSRLELDGWAARPSRRAEDGKLHAPLFVRREAWAEGRRFAFRRENLESAAVFSGRLMQDRQTPEIFVVVDACIEATHAEEKSYSVLLTGDSWSQVQRVLEHRRQRLGRPHEIIVGSVHGHPFPPGLEREGRPTCGDCPKQPTCTQTTAAASTDDVAWHRTIFAGQPWAMLAVWGLNARDEERWRAYGLAGGTLASRPLRILEE